MFLAESTCAALVISSASLVEVVNGDPAEFVTLGILIYLIFFF